MGYSILIVEDEQRMRELLAVYFRKADFKCFPVENGDDAVDVFFSEKIDVVLLDIMIPGINGWEVCKNIRKESDVPIIMITAKSEEDDKLMGFELGADDYVTKPFSPKVLVARTLNLLKRAKGHVTGDEGVIDIAGININTKAYEVKIEGAIVNMSPKEYELLIYLIDNKNRVVTREGILNNVWGYDYFGDLRTVDTHIKKLRSKLGDKAQYVKTVIRAGYKFEVK